MNRPAPFTQVSLKRAMLAAEKVGKKLVIWPDGRWSFEDKDEADPTPVIPSAPERKWVL